MTDAPEHIPPIIMIIQQGRQGVSSKALSTLCSPFWLKKRKYDPQLGILLPIVVAERGSKQQAKQWRQRIASQS